MALPISGATTLYAVHTAAAAPRYSQSRDYDHDSTVLAPSARAVTATTSSASTTADLNLRAGPSLQNQILTTMPFGSGTAIAGTPQNGFYPVVYRGLRGWAYGAYLSTGGGTPLVAGGPVVTTSTVAPVITPAPSAAGGSIVAIITAAATRYGQSSTDMLRVATCESSLNPAAVNPTSGTMGLFQFLPSTWASTPYAGDSPTNAWASANAAAWMWSVGRRGAWACQ
ncbi:MAG TPA: SH3 domain-containing protein [Thermomicrobiaceae bacterium]|nr:SH3 domain-containing protein [Thermomicrobiaceae bacterium]